MFIATLSTNQRPEKMSLLCSSAELMHALSRSTDTASKLAVLARGAQAKRTDVRARPGQAGRVGRKFRASGTREAA